MSGSDVPVSFESGSSDGMMRVLVTDLSGSIETAKLFVYVNKTNTVFVVRLIPSVLFHFLFGGSGPNQLAIDLKRLS